MTIDWLTLQNTAHREFAVRLHAVADWNAPTPDTEWNTRQLVTHVIEEQQWVPLLLEGRTLREARAYKRPLGADLSSEWAHYSKAATDAWAAAAPDARVQLSYDTVTVTEYLREQVSDVTIHSWDLARATGTSEALDEGLVEAVWTVFEPQKATLEASGLFSSIVPVPDDAPLQSRLLALTGRDDRLSLSA
ncbi:TIGR03086 family metal-binding protein [Agreia sp. COWG]|uniref:TIGR03086 family metal-binding protein n=1 Tax=Agreia sp. COWG TaxID=2773266 RepID=UPI001926DCBC|nr:TIGR03086 family metal-binding protein [Agreia sp. COWG]CAD5995820.1 MDMPI_N domain-containing protein [Agreia sp. COWG]